MSKDVHTEHCCVEHGCKYGSPDCTVTTRQKFQSYACELCENDTVEVVSISSKELNRLRKVEADMDSLRVSLRDQHLVHVNMLRGVISTPSKEQLLHMLGDEAQRKINTDYEPVIKGLVEHILRNTCPHEVTHRGGVIWEICSFCGEKWADDEGGKPEFKLPECVINAQKVLSS